MTDSHHSIIFRTKSQPSRDRRITKKLLRFLFFKRITLSMHVILVERRSSSIIICSSLYGTTSDPHTRIDSQLLDLELAALNHSDFECTFTRQAPLLMWYLYSFSNRPKRIHFIEPNYIVRRLPCSARSLDLMVAATMQHWTTPYFWRVSQSEPSCRLQSHHNFFKLISTSILQRFKCSPLPVSTQKRWMDEVTSDAGKEEIQV